MPRNMIVILYLALSALSVYSESAFPQYLLLNGPVERTLKEITNCETYFDNKPQTMNTNSSKIQKEYLWAGGG